MSIETLEKSINDFNEKTQQGFANTAKSIESIKGRLDKLEVKGNRPGISDTGDHERARKSLAKFITTGDDGDLERKDVSVGSANDGGVAVPEVISSDIDQQVVEISPVRQVALVSRIQTNPGSYKRLVDTRGTASGWVGETENRPNTDTPQLQEITFPDGEIYANPRATQRSIDDMQVGVAAWFQESVATEFAFQEGDAFINGDGINKPRGFLSGTITNESDDARAFGSLQYIATGVDGAFPTSDPSDILVDLYHTLKAGYRQGAVWMMTSDTLALIRKFKDADGNFIWRAGIEPGQPDRLLGYPVIEAEQMPAIATNSYSVAFGNFRRGYEIVDRSEVRTLRDPFTAKPYVNFYTTKRVSGAVVNSEAIKLLRFATS
ncbi:MAG: phage major capsid protein [Pseudomonadota bacterium]